MILNYVATSLYLILEANKSLQIIRRFVFVTMPRWSTLTSRLTSTTKVFSPANTS